MTLVETHRIGSVDRAELLGLGELRRAMLTDAQEVREALDAGRPLGPTTPFEKVNRLLGGYLRPGLHFVTGGPGIGKTAFALQIAAQCPMPAIFVSCEIDATVLLKRIAARVTGTPIHQFDGGLRPDGRSLSVDDIMARIDKAILTTPRLSIGDAAAGGVSAGEIEEWVIDSRGPDGKVLVVIDSFHTWAGTDDPGELGTKLDELRRLSRKIKCPILAISERSKAERKDATELSGAGTRKIGYWAETMIALDPCESSGHEDGVRISLSKNRHGRKNKSEHLLFDGELQSFRERP